MVLQTLFALYSLFPAVPVVAPHPTASTTTTITIRGGRFFTAQIFMPRGMRSFDSKYPGAVVVATEDTRDRAYLVANRLSEIGVTAMMYIQEDFATYRLQLADARAAVDSMRRRADVRFEEVGVVAFEQATNIVPDLARDTALGFAIAASSERAAESMRQRYAQSHAATLIVQAVGKGVDRTEIPLTAITQQDGNSRADPPPTASITATAGETQQMAPNVTLWAVAKEQLEGMGDAKSPLGTRVVNWVKEQVHAIPIIQQQPTISIH